MKKTLLAIGLAVASMPLIFAAQAPSAPPASSSSAPTTSSSTTTAKKHVKKQHKNKKTQAPATETNGAKPNSK